MEKSEEEACLMAMQLAAGSILPMVLKSAIELDLFELIKKADEAAGISASELAAKLSTTNPDAPNMLHRILRLLAVHSVLTSSGGSPPRYSLSRLGNFFTKNQDGGSVAPISLFVQDKVLMESWYHLKDAIMEGGTAFNRAHGMSVFEYAAVDQKLSNRLNQTMCNLTIHMSKLIEMYKGFEGLNSLVDVGGGIGTTLDMIVSKYPSIRGINFDLPHVIRDAPSYPGMEHVGGDMFMSVPKGDAIFMKFITHDWGDAKCLKILRNCHEALPEHGKVIIADFVLADIPANYSAQTAFNVLSDVMQLTYNPGGKERTEMEFRALATEAGFKEFRKLCTAFTMSIMELHK